MDMEARRYSTGCKSFLVGLNVGEEKVMPPTLKFHSVKSIASRMYYSFGCIFRCTKREGVNYVKRLA